MPVSGDTGGREMWPDGGDGRDESQRRRGVLRLHHQHHHFNSPTARRCVCQAVCGQVDGLSFFLRRAEWG
jgi:hypothetical protein